MNAIEAANGALSFLLEIAVYAGVVVRAFSLRAVAGRPLIGRSGAVARAGLAVASVIVMAAAWGVFAAPGAGHLLHGVARLAFELLWFGVGVVALWSARHARLGLVLAVVYVVNGLLRLHFHQV